MLARVRYLVQTLGWALALGGSVLMLPLAALLFLAAVVVWVLLGPVPVDIYVTPGSGGLEPALWLSVLALVIGLPATGVWRKLAMRWPATVPPGARVAAPRGQRVAVWTVGVALVAAALLHAWGLLGSADGPFDDVEFREFGLLGLLAVLLAWAARAGSPARALLRGLLLAVGTTAAVLLLEAAWVARVNGRTPFGDWFDGLGTDQAETFAPVDEFAVAGDGLDAILFGPAALQATLAVSMALLLPWLSAAAHRMRAGARTRWPGVVSIGPFVVAAACAAAAHQVLPAVVTLVAAAWLGQALRLGRPRPADAIDEPAERPV
ncbi:MAG: hypothetical protein PGN13_12985 [Patulibacter minatonensis]